MGKENLVSQEQRQPYRPDAVLLCTSPDGHKYTGMSQNIVGEYQSEIKISGFTPHDIPEEIYNGEIGKFPDAIAAAKVLQVASRYPWIMPRCFSDTNIEAPLLIANDIIFEVEKGNGERGWTVVNKPKQDADISSIRHSLQMLLSEKGHDYCNFIEARFRCGAAAYDPVSKRGIMGVLEIPFWFTSFSEKEIDMYIEKYAHDLHSTNGSCRWEDPEIFVPHLVMVNNVMLDDIQYASTLKHFHNVALGALPGIGSLIGQASQFIFFRAEGNHTGCMRDVNNRFLHYQTSGVWGVWRTENLH